MEQFEKFNSKKAVRIALLVLLDIVGINLAQFLALFIRFEFSLSAIQASGFGDSVITFAPWNILLCLAIFWAMGLYNSLWAYVGLKEALRISEAAVSCSILEYFFVRMVHLPLPRSFPVLNALLLGFFMILCRFGYRLVRMLYRGNYGTHARTMLIGAGNGGDIVLHEFSSSKQSRNKIVCIIDDDPEKRGMRLNGVPVVGGRDKIRDAAEKYHVQEIIFAIPSCSHAQRREILTLCRQTGLPTKTLPGLSEIANGKVTVQKLRRVEIEDLLGRDSVQVNMSEIDQAIKGKIVMVTGGGGSIGSELCRQIAAREPRQLIIFDIYENNAYAIQQELIRQYPDMDLQVVIGSVRDTARVEQVFSQYRPQIIYHAAAHKHVPLMEDSPNEAIKNNVFGTYHVAEAAVKYGAETFVLISTDKAVNPTNIMGASKRICEMIVQMFARKDTNTKFVAVRFGNVLGSSGSVIPLFRKQIEAGGPVTVTHKDIIRYFMTIPEAVSLVMQAGVYTKDGEIFVLDMGDPVRIDDLARNMIRLSGLEPDVDIPIVYTGLRPGEKLFEELLMSEEGLEKTANDLIFVGHPNGFSDEGLMTSLARLETLCQNNSPDIVKEIAALVTTYHAPDIPPTNN